MEFRLKLDLIIEGEVAARVIEDFCETKGIEAIRHMLRKICEHQDKNKDAPHLKVKAELIEKESGRLVSIYAD